MGNGTQKELKKLHNYIVERAKSVGEYVIYNKATLRKTAKVFGVSKSTIFIDCVQRLPSINPVLANNVKNILDYNKRMKGFRGGQAVKEKYINI